jgi:hypothetical protein
MAAVCMIVPTFVAGREAEALLMGKSGSILNTDRTQTRTEKIYKNT